MDDTMPKRHKHKDKAQKRKKKSRSTAYRLSSAESVTIKDLDDDWRARAQKLRREQEQEQDSEDAEDSGDEEEAKDGDMQRRKRSRSQSEDGDLSPPRRRRDSSSSEGDMGERRRADSASSSDISVPRRRKRADSEEEGDEGDEARRRDGSAKGDGENSRRIERLKDALKIQGVPEGQQIGEDRLKYEWGVGAVDKKKAKQAQEDLEEAKTRGFAVYADDEKLNNDLKGEILPDDPMIGYLQSSKVDDYEEGDSLKRPKYSGPTPPPNRFGIMPGYRWDGVDRSNGFERKHLAGKR